MRTKILFLTLALLITNVPAYAQLKDENLLISPPPGFKVGFESDKNKVIMQEWVPQGQTVDEWTDMVTVQIFLGGKDLDDKQFADFMTKQWSSACQGGTGTPAASSLDNGYASSSFTLSCPLNTATGKPEYTLVKAIKGTDSFYAVQKAFRFTPSQEQIAQWSQYLNNVHVCDTRGDTHPCPTLKPIAP